MSQTRVLEIVGAQVQALATDPELLGYLGGPHVYERMSEDEIAQIPGVYWYFPTPLALTEMFEETVVRYDVYCMGTAQAFLIENCIRRLLHSNLPTRRFANVGTFSQVLPSVDMTNGIMGQDDIAHRVVPIGIQPVRLRPRPA